MLKVLYMKKIVWVTAAILGIGGIAYTGSAWYFGQQIDAQLSVAYQRFNDNLVRSGLPQGAIKFRQDSKQRGLFSTYIKDTLIIDASAFNPDSGIKEVIELPFETVVYHGPFFIMGPNTGKTGFASLRGKMLPPDIPQLKQKMSELNIGHILQVEGIVDFARSSHFNISMPKVEVNDLVTVNFSGINYEVISNVLTDDPILKSTENFSMPNFNVEVPGIFKFQLEDLSSQSVTSWSVKNGEPTFEMMVSDGEMNLKRFGLEAVAGLPVPVKVEINNWKIPVKVNKTTESPSLEAQMGLHIGEVLVNSLSFGQGGFDIAFNFPDANQLKQFADYLAAMTPESMESLEHDFDQQMVMIKTALRLYEGSGLKLNKSWQIDTAKAQSEIAIQLNSELTAKLEGVMDGSLEPDSALVMGIVKELAAKAAIDEQLIALFIQRGLKVTSPHKDEQSLQAEADQAKTMVLMLLGMTNIFKSENGQLLLDFSFKDNQATLNGESLPVQALLDQYLFADEDMNYDEAPEIQEEIDINGLSPEEMKQIEEELQKLEDEMNNKTQ